MSFLHRAGFFTTASTLDNLELFESAGEVAFAGRSNAGKSSVINTLANQKRLAFTSKTPGRTQQLNYFGLGDDKYLVDLPGYGYAKVQKSERARWDLFLSAYLSTRAPLAGMVLIMDARHPLTELDVQMLDWFAVTEKPVHVLLTKADKLTRNQQGSTLLKTRSTLNQRIGTNTVSLFSSLKKTGIDEAEQVLSRWFDIPLPEKKTSALTRASGAKAPAYKAATTKTAAPKALQPKT